jgi:hypothetical protein
LKLKKLDEARTGGSLQKQDFDAFLAVAKLG